MEIPKDTKKWRLKPKGGTNSPNISSPFAVKHDIHVGREDFEKRLVDSPLDSPPTPCLQGSRDNSGDTPTLTESLSQFFQQEVKPSLLLEIENIIEKKRRPLGNQTKYPVIPHCQTCSCLKRGEMTEPDLNHEYTDIRRGKPYPQPQRPSSCNFVYNEEKKLLEKEVKLFAVGDFLDSGDGTVIPLAINNSFYHTADQTQHGKQFIKYGSDLDTGHSVALARANTFSGVAKGVQLSRSERNDIENNHRGRVLHKPDQRECLARALQCHVGELVDGIIFKDSELPDHLLADGCLTEEECSEVRQKLERKDQVRVLISMIKGRDLEILEKFLRHIRTHNNSLASKIEEKFSQNVKESVKCTMCAFCSSTTQVNLKYIVDALWQNRLIDDGMFNLIVHTDRPTGAQGDLWHRVINYLNSADTSEVRGVLVKALTIKGHYHHIAKGVAWIINANGELKCRCHLQNKIMPARSITSLASSKSPRSSESEFATYSQSYVSLVSTQLGNATVKGPTATRDEINSTVLPSVDTQVQSQMQCVPNNGTVKKLVDEYQRNVTTMQGPRYRNTQEDIALRVTPFKPKGVIVSSKSITCIPDELEVKAP